MNLSSQTNPLSLDPEGLGKFDLVKVLTHLLPHAPQTIIPEVPGTAYSLGARVDISNGVSISHILEERG